MNQVVEPKQPSEIVRHWVNEIAAARKREQTYRREGRRVKEIYDGAKKDQIPFNILFSNTETLFPALYNSTPRPVVQRRFKDADPLGKASSTAGQRMLEFAVDTNSDEYPPFDDVMGDVVLDALLPGRGAARLRYDADIVGEKPARYVKSELVCYESLKWDRWVHGFARKWKRVPWIAFEHDVDQKEAEKLFGKSVADKLVFTEEDRTSNDKEDDHEDDAKTDEDRRVAKVWEIWVKKTKKVLFVSPNYIDGLLKEEADPLNLTGFYPLPEPLRFIRKANDLRPTAPYALYENQAKELNRISQRINRLIEALKVRGAYDSTIGELQELLRKEDNALVPADNVAALQDGGLEKAIWLMPIDKLITVVQQLFIARQQCKQVIYEITGISDILRGQSVASETATAQEIKNQWGTLRLKRMQRDVQRYARDMLRMTLEIAAKRFSEKTFAQMTGLPFATAPEVQAAQGQIAAARGMLAMQGIADPQQMQAAMQQSVPEALQVLQKPQWAQVLQLLKNDTQRAYRIDIETNSTVDVEATEDQKQMGEVLTAVSQFIQGISPLVISGSMPFEVAQSMLLAFVRRYRMGSEIEDFIKQMKPPQNPEDGKRKAEQEKQSFELQKAQAEFQLQQQEQQAKLEMERELAQVDMQVKMMELEAKKEEIALRRQLLQAQTQAKIAQLQAQVAAAHAMPKKPAQQGKKKEASNAPA